MSKIFVSQTYIEADPALNKWFSDMIFIQKEIIKKTRADSIEFSKKDFSIKNLISNDPQHSPERPAEPEACTARHR